MQPTSSPRFGFSIVELVVVCSVLVVLSLLLLPALATVRASAHNAFCRNQLRQIGVCFSAYAVDNRGNLPPSQLRGWQVTADMKATGNAHGQWFRFIMPYVDDYSGFCQCPLANYKRNSHPFMSNTDVYGASYGHGGGLLGAMGLNSDEQWHISIRRLANPGRNILMSERWAVRTDGHFSNATWVDPPWKTRLMHPSEGRVPLPGGNHASWRVSHRGTSNILLADLRVEGLTPEASYMPSQLDRRGLPGTGGFDLWLGPQ